MNLKTVNALLAEVEDGLMGGLAAVDVFSKSSGMSVAGIRSSPKACALFNILCERISETIKKSGLPVPDYLHQTMLRLGDDGNVMIVVIDLDAKYRWGMAVDCTKASARHPRQRRHPRHAAPPARSPPLDETSSAGRSFLEGVRPHRGRAPSALRSRRARSAPVCLCMQVDTCPKGQLDADGHRPPSLDLGRIAVPPGSGDD
jgi:hypothetical protein